MLIAIPIRVVVRMTEPMTPGSRTNLVISWIIFVKN